MNMIGQSVLQERNGLRYFEIPAMAHLGWIKHGFLTRMGGTSHPPYGSLNVSLDNGDQEEDVLRNRRRIANAFGFDPDRLILLHQMHQDQILFLPELTNFPPPPREYDALITKAPYAFLGIQTADCLPIFIVDQKQKVVAAIHAGRQGTALQITAKVLRNMEEKYGCQLHDLLIAMGPSIGPCCYEIDEKVFLPEWNLFSTSKGDGKRMLDLGRINIAQLKGEGIKEEQIFQVNLCTHCYNVLFFSYRRERRTGRQLSFIGII